MNILAFVAKVYDNSGMKTVYHAVKRIFDLIATLLLLPLIIIFTVVIAVAILLTDGRPVFFSQERAGKAMKPFKLFKFRSMRVNADPFGPSPKDGEDPRITPVGKWLRLTSLDELPQFINVFLGQMTLIGPRPLYMDQAREWNERQRRRLEVKPGLTGLAQISGRGSLTIEEKLELDVNYVEQENPWLDIKILFVTAFKIIVPSDIYEKQYSKMQKTRGDKENES